MLSIGTYALKVTPTGCRAGELADDTKVFPVALFLGRWGVGVVIVRLHAARLLAEADGKRDQDRQASHGFSGVDTNDGVYPSRYPCRV